MMLLVGLNIVVYSFENCCMFGVVYETSADLLAKIPVLIEEIINNTKNASYDRAHFSGYGEYSLDFEVVYFINTSDYNIYLHECSTANKSNG